MNHPLRQPVHTVYGGAHLFKADLARKLGGLALRALNEHAPDAAALGAAFGLDEATASAVHPRVVEKLTSGIPNGANILTASIILATSLSSAHAAEVINVIAQRIAFQHLAPLHPGDAIVERDPSAGDRRGTRWRATSYPEWASRP